MINNVLKLYNMKRTIIIATMLAIVSVSAIAQNNDFRPSITIGYGRNFVDMGNAFEIYEDTYAEAFSAGSIFISADFLRFNRYLSGGLYLGGQKSMFKSYDENGPFYCGEFAGRAGVAAHLHILQCMNVEQNAWDISLNTSLGAFWCPNISPQTEYNLGLSAAYYPIKHVGLSVGCDWGKTLVSSWNDGFVQKGSISLKLGLNIRFGK